MNDERVNINLGVDVEKTLLRKQLNSVTEGLNFWMGVAAVCLKQIGIGVDVLMTPGDMKDLLNNKMVIQAKQAEDGKSVLVRIISEDFQEEQKEPVVTGDDEVLNVNIEFEEAPVDGIEKGRPVENG